MGRALDHRVAGFMLREARQAQVIDQTRQLVRVAGPEPGRPQIDTVEWFCAGRWLARCGRAGDAPAQTIARFQQHVVVQALLLQQTGGIQTTQAGANDGDARCLHGYACSADDAASAVRVRWPVLR